MAWENFWKAAPDGRRLTTDQQLAGFRSHFAERIVEPNPAIGRPLMMVLERPYKLARTQTGDAYEQRPVQLRDLQGWPPKLSLSRFGYLPRPGDGDLVDAKVVSAPRPGSGPILMIQGEFQEQEATCSISGYPEILLQCVARTLNDHSGEDFRSLSDLELVGVD